VTQLAYWSTCAGGPIAYSEYWILANGAVTCIGLFEMNWPIAAMIKISLGYRPNSHAPMNVYYLRHSTDWINAAMRPVHSKWTELELNWSYWVCRRPWNGIHAMIEDMPGSPVAVQAGASLLGRRLPSRVRQHSALSALSWRCDLQQLWRQNFYTATSPVELSSSPAA